MHSVSRFCSNADTGANLRDDQMRCCGLLQIRQLTRNIHDIEVKGKFEALVVWTENLPSHANLKTSYIAVLSAIATLAKLTESVRVGT